MNMKARLDQKNKAIELRRLGLSYKEIQEQVPVSKGLLSLWLAHLPLTQVEQILLKKKLEDRKNRGRLNSKILNQARMVEREKRIIKEAEILFKKSKNDPLFLIGITLFWCHGSKGSQVLNFSSSDTDTVFIMYTWIQKYLLLKKDTIKVRLFISDSPNIDTFRSFWAKNMGIPLEKISISLGKRKDRGIKNNPYYKGCILLSVTKVKYKKMMIAWQKFLINTYGKALLSHK
jgi:hypothetical protein